MTAAAAAAGGAAAVGGWVDGRGPGNPGGLVGGHADAALRVVGTSAAVGFVNAGHLAAGLLVHVKAAAAAAAAASAAGCSAVADVATARMMPA